MKINYKILFYLGSLVLTFSFSNQALAKATNDFSTASCRCYSDLSLLTPANFLDGNNLTSICLQRDDGNCDVAHLTDDQKKKNKVDCKRSTDSNDLNSATFCQQQSSQWLADYNAKAKNVTAGGAAGQVSGATSNISQLIIDCGQPGVLSKWNPNCKDITVFVSLLIQLVKYLFGIIGAVALGVFVYGGFTLVLSQGNQEKVQSGTGAMVNAVIGMFISFTAYVLVTFVANALGVVTKYTLF